MNGVSGQRCRSRWALVGLLALAACSGGSTNGDGDAADAGADDAPVLEITPPDIPWLDAGRPPIALPRFTPCPPGWREVTDPDSLDVVTCDPWPEAGHEECTAVDEAHFPGEPGCARIGTACDTDDDWATDLPGDRPIRYVLAGTAPAGDGTRAAPFATIEAAMVGIDAGTIVAVGKGSYDEVVLIPSGVTVWGACVAETLVASSTLHETAGTINAWGDGGVVRNLRLGGERLGVAASGDRRSVELRDVAVAGAVRAGVWVVDGARLAAATVVVRDTRSRASDRQWGRALHVSNGAAVTIGRGAFERNREVGVSAFDAGTTVTLEDVAVRDTQTRESDHQGGQGVHAEGGPTVEVRRGVVERNHDVGVIVLQAGTTVTLEDVVVRDTQSRENDRQGGRGLQVNDGAAAAVRRGVFERDRDVAVVAATAGTAVTLEDVVVRDTQSQESDGRLGRGLHVSDGATLELRRGAFERNRSYTIVMMGAGTTATLEDVVVRDTRSQESDGLVGRALEASAEAVAAVRRGAFERNREVAVGAFDTGTTLTLEDVVVRDTRSQESDRRLGRGLNAQGGATATVRRAVFDRNREAAVAVAGADTSATLEDVEVRDTVPADCADDPFPCPGAGSGFVSLGGANITATRFVVTRSALCGVQLAYGADESGVRFPEGGTMDLHEGEISFSTASGANVQTAGFDISRLFDGVIFHDNGTNLDTTELPVPDPAVPSDEP